MPWSPVYSIMMSIPYFHRIMRISHVALLCERETPVQLEFLRCTAGLSESVLTRVQRRSARGSCDGCSDGVCNGSCEHCYESGILMKEQLRFGDNNLKCEVSLLYIGAIYCDSCSLFLHHLFSFPLHEFASDSKGGVSMKSKTTNISGMNYSEQSPSLDKG